MAEPMSALRARREALGADLESVAEELRIPVQHLRAIEAGRMDQLPVGPYRAGWVKAYCAWLDVEPEPWLARVDAAAVAGRSGGVPLGVVRGVAAVVCLLAGGLLVYQLWPGGGASESVGGDAPVVVPGGPDQRVAIEVRRSGPLKVVVDGVPVLDRTVRPGETFEVEGHDRVEVHLDGAEAAKVEYNGELVVPLGRQDAPRRLVFIDDVAPEARP